MPINASARESLEQKIQFLQAHPLEELWQAKRELGVAKGSWDYYLEDHKKYAEIAKSITVLRSDNYKKARVVLEEATTKYTQLKAQFEVFGIEDTDTVEELTLTLERINSKEEAERFRNQVFKKISCESFQAGYFQENSSLHREGTLSALEQEIKDNSILLPPDKQKLVQEVRELAQKTEQRLLVEVDLPAYAYENLKSLDFHQRKIRFEYLYRNINLPELRVKLRTQYEEIEKRIFTEQEVKSLGLENLGIPALESLRSEYSRLLEVVSQRYGSFDNLKTQLCEQLGLAYRNSEKKLLRAQELRPVLTAAAEELSYSNLVSISEEEREKKLNKLCDSWGEDYLDLVHHIKEIYSETLGKIHMTREYEERYFSDWNLESLKHESPESIEERLQQKLNLIKQIPDEHYDIRQHLHCEADEIGQLGILHHKMQYFPVKLWSLKTLTERQKYRLEFIDALPLLVGHNKLVHEIDRIFRYTEAEIQLAKMHGALKQLENSALDIHQEVQLDVPFQEAEIEFDKLNLRKHATRHVSEREHALVHECNKLRERHALVLEENRLIRSAVQDLNALERLSFEAQERAMPWIAGKWFKVLRTQEVLRMIGVAPLNESLAGNLTVDSKEYQLSTLELSLLQIYTQEALRLFKEDSSKRGWLSYQIERELHSVEQQIGGRM